MIDVYLCFHREAGWYFVPKEAVYDPNWRTRLAQMKPATEKFPGPLPAGVPSFQTIRHSGHSFYVGYYTAADAGYDNDDQSILDG